MFAKEYQVKQFVAEIQGDRSRFRVFTTGDQKYYLFCQIENSIDTGLHIPVLKSELRDDIRKALSQGWGN